MPAAIASTPGDRLLFSTREWVLLIVALAVVIAGTTAAALSPLRSASAASRSDAPTPTATPTAAHACPASEAVGVAGVATGAADSALSTSTATTTTVEANRAVASVRTVTRTVTAPSLSTVGSIVEFGTYGAAPLKWRVLSISGDQILLLSEYVLTAGAFRSDWEGTNASLYSASDVRAWLNGTFTTTAFTTQQSAALLNHAGGAAGSDRVFLLSAAEVATYLPKAAKRKAAPHALAGPGHTGFSGEVLTVSGAYAAWWLADAASDEFSAKVVEPNGKLGHRLVYYADLGVRPAIKVNRAKVTYALNASGGN